MQDLDPLFSQIGANADAFDPEVEAHSSAKDGPRTEDRSYDQLAAYHKAIRASIKNDDMRLAAEMRRKSAWGVFLYLVGYSIFSAVVILLQGFHLWGFMLPETSLDILIGSTAVSAIGLVAIVLRGLFPFYPKKPSKS